ncbi:hypothetical protein EDD15DRAFT_2204345 [Pisolithus albus]|nr:hypothetical protein EDD15DRAFT_2204345 [Pisolithus albus]
MSDYDRNSESHEYLLDLSPEFPDDYDFAYSPPVSQPRSPTNKNVTAVQSLFDPTVSLPRNPHSSFTVQTLSKGKRKASPRTARGNPYPSTSVVEPVHRAVCNTPDPFSRPSAPVPPTPSSVPELAAPSKITDVPASGENSNPDRDTERPSGLICSADEYVGYLRVLEGFREWDVAGWHAGDQHEYLRMLHQVYGALEVAGTNTAQSLKAADTKVFENVPAVDFLELNGFSTIEQLSRAETCIINTLHIVFSPSLWKSFQSFRPLNPTPPPSPGPSCTCLAPSSCGRDHGPAEKGKGVSFADEEPGTSSRRMDTSTREVKQEVEEAEKNALPRKPVAVSPAASRSGEKESSSTSSESGLQVEDAHLFGPRWFRICRERESEEKAAKSLLHLAAQILGERMEDPWTDESTRIDQWRAFFNQLYDDRSLWQNNIHNATSATKPLPETHRFIPIDSDNPRLRLELGGRVPLDFSHPFYPHTCMDCRHLGHWACRHGRGSQWTNSDGFSPRFPDKGTSKSARRK